MEKEMVSKKILARAIKRNASIFNRKIDEDSFPLYVETYHENLPLMDEEEFKRVDNRVLTTEKFFPCIADYAKAHDDIFGWK